MEILGILGTLIALFVALLGLISFLSDSKFINNDILIKGFRDRKSLQSDKDFKSLKFVIEYDINENNYNELTLFINRSIQLKKVALYSVKYENKKLIKGTLLKEFKNIRLDTGILFNIYNSETIPNILLEWTLDFGIKGKYYFTENCFNGNRNITRYGYNKTFLNKIREKINWR